LGACALLAGCSGKVELGDGDLGELADGGGRDAASRRADADPDDDEGDAQGAQLIDPNDAEIVIIDAGSDGDGGRGGDGGIESCGALKATIRDFKAAHADFEGPGNSNVNLGIVLNDLGADHKPVYNDATPMISTSGAANFNQWYRDVDGINQAFDVDIAFTQTQPGLFVYDSNQFFPIDGRGFGNEGNPHNFHFTTEIHTRFTYKGGEVFTFRGDDDVWAFVNNKLAIDLGGLHQPRMTTINFDQRAAELGLTRGETYPMDIFHAERHTVESNFRIETSIACFTPVTLF
jgi:fibro-slime domain-containing protein